MAWASVRGSCEEPGDACSSGWIKRCEKGRAQISLLLSLPPSLCASDPISCSRHPCTWCLHSVSGSCRAALSRRQSQPSSDREPLLSQVPAGLFSSTTPQTINAARGAGQGSQISLGKQISSPAESWSKVGNKMLKSTSIQNRACAWLFFVLPLLEDV